MPHGPEPFRQQPARTSEVEDLARRSGLEQRRDPTVRTVLTGFELILLVEGDAAAIAETGLLHPIGHDVLGDVGGVAQAVDIADLIAVVGGNRYFSDSHPGVVELDDDLGVEVEPVGVPLERDLLESTDQVGAISDRKSTRLNSSHLVISYAVFCL